MAEEAAVVVEQTQVAQPEVAQETVAPEQKEPPKPVYTQEDMDRITAKVKRNAADRARKQAEARFAGLRQGIELAQPKQQAVATAEPKADEGPRREQYDDYESFLKAEARFEASQTVKKELDAARKADADKASRTVRDQEQQSWQQQLAKAREEIEDYDEVCAESNAVCTEAMANAMRESDVGAKIAHHLAKNPDEAERISKLKASKQAAEIVKLEAQFEPKPAKGDKAADGTATTAAAKSPSKAPAPIKPVGQTADATLAFDTTDPKAAEKLSTAEWIRLDRERMLKSARP